MDSDRPRLVLDTNVFISALISAVGPPARILRAIRNKKAIHLVSDPIVDEYFRVLDYPRIRKFQVIDDAFVSDIAAYLAFWTERVEVVSSIALSPDTDDNVFLATALDGKATTLVSGDKAHLLSLGAVEAIPILSTGEAVARLGL